MVKTKGSVVMDKITIEAVERKDKPKKVRRDGFIPAVLSGPGITSTSVQFKGTELNRIIEKYGTAVKLWIQLGNEEKYGFLKEIQRDPVEGKVIHVSIQLVSTDEDVKMQLPILFQGGSVLERNLMQLQIEKSEIEVEGKTMLMPSHAVVDVSGKRIGDSVTAGDFHLPSGIRVLDSGDQVYASVKGAKKVSDEETEETQPAEQ